jgi:small-conductance mechanosensitive channel
MWRHVFLNSQSASNRHCGATLVCTDTAGSEEDQRIAGSDDVLEDLERRVAELVAEMQGAAQQDRQVLDTRRQALVVELQGECLAPSSRAREERCKELLVRLGSVG